MREFEITVGPNTGRRVVVVKTREDEPDSPLWNEWDQDCFIRTTDGLPFGDPEKRHPNAGFCKAEILRPL